MGERGDRHVVPGVRPEVEAAAAPSGSLLLILRPTRLSSFPRTLGSFGRRHILSRPSCGSVLLPALQTSHAVPRSAPDGLLRHHDHRDVAASRLGNRVPGTARLPIPKREHEVGLRVEHPDVAVQAGPPAPAPVRLVHLDCSRGSRRSSPRSDPRRGRRHGGIVVGPGGEPSSARWIAAVSVQVRLPQISTLMAFKNGIQGFCRCFRRFRNISRVPF